MRRILDYLRGKPRIGCTRLHRNAQLPHRATHGAAGFDIFGSFSPETPAPLDSVRDLRAFAHCKDERLDPKTGIIWRCAGHAKDVMWGHYTPVGWLLQPGTRLLIPTGLRLSMPAGWEAQVRSRSGLALRLGLSVLNSPGTIDADYEGEVGVILHNHGDRPAGIYAHTAVAQLVFQRVWDVTLVALQEEPALAAALPRRARDGGFGSTSQWGRRRG